MPTESSTIGACEGAFARLDPGAQRGTFVAPSRTTVRDFVELWLDGVKAEVALTSWVSYRQAARR